MRGILRIDMGAAGGPSASLEVLGGYAGPAGRAMASRVLADEVDPACAPLAPANRLVIAAGAPAGARSGAAPVAIGCASPLSGDLVVTHAEGPPAAALRRLGVAAVVVQGQPAAADLWKVVIDGGGVSFASARELGGLGNLDTVERLRRSHGPGAAYLTIGEAGEARLAAASVSCPADGARGTRHCGRGGAGAVMGSKRLKAIVVDAGDPAAGGADAPAPWDAGAPYAESCGIDDPRLLAGLARMADDLGVDGAEIARAIRVAMEAGLARVGDGHAALRLLAEVGRGTPLGRILGSGARAARSALGLVAEPVLTSVFGVPEDDLARLFRALDPGLVPRADGPPRSPLAAGLSGRGRLSGPGGPSRKN